MKKLFYEPDVERLDLFQKLLEEDGISTSIQIPHLSEIEPPLPLPKCFPFLCEIDDNDYEYAMECIRKYISLFKEERVPCPYCGDSNPVDFLFCWACAKPAPPKSTC